MPRKVARSNRPKSAIIPKKKAAKRSYYQKPSKGPLEAMGKNIGSFFGKTGMKVGKYLGKAAGVITGSGSYEIHKNSLINEQVPFVHSSNEVVRIKHREFLGNINGSVNYNSITYNINPGLTAAFPWLYSTALSFEQYKIEGMIVEFVSTCGDAIASTNNTLGTVCISTDYNVVNDDFTTMAQCQNSMWSATGKPSKNILMPIECDGKLNVLERLFIRNDTTNLSNSDLRLYDHCKINISTEGMQVATQIGQIWISYDISFFKPVLTNALAPKTTHYNINNIVAGNLFANNSLVLKNNAIGVYFDNINQRIYFPKGSVGKKYGLYLVAYHPLGTTYTNIEYNYSFVGLSSYNVINSGVSNQLDVPASTSSISVNSGPSLIVCFNVDSADAYIQILGGVGLSATKGELFIWQYN